MKINSVKSHILFWGNGNVSTNMDDNTIISENKNELLGMVLDSKLFLKDHIKNLCKKASQKLNALVEFLHICVSKKGKQLWKHMYNLNLARPLVWMYHRWDFNNKVNSLYKKTWRITWGDKSSSFQNLLKKR